MRYRLFAGAVALALAGTFAIARQRANPSLPTGRWIEPIGEHVAVGSLPVNMALSPDGRYVVVTNAGWREFLTVLDAATGKVVSQLDVNGTGKGEKPGLYYGLAFGEGGALPGTATRPEDVKWTLYASRGGEKRVAIYELRGDGQLTDTGRSLSAPGTGRDGKGPCLLAGVAAFPAAGRVYAADNYTGRESGMKGRLLIFGTDPPALAKTVTMPGFPLAVVAGRGGRYGRVPAVPRVYVTSERDGTVTAVDPMSGQILATVPTGDHPAGLLLSWTGAMLFVANSGSDTVSVVETRTHRIARTIPLRPPDVRGLPGCTPMGMALSADGRSLYVALADLNAVAVVDVGEGTVRGYIPAGWYPTSVVSTADDRLFVANGKGLQARNPNAREVGKWGHYIQSIIEGAVSMVRVPNSATLAQMTARVIANARATGADLAAARTPLGRTGIRHVIYVVKENRTYDQVLGDVAKGNGDAAIAFFGRRVTPNQHALVERFALLDNFYCTAEVSADGWSWSTQGIATEYPSRNAPYGYSGRPHDYDYEGENNGVPVDLFGIPDVNRQPNGYIWDAVLKKGLSYRNYGFLVTSNKGDVEVNGQRKSWPFNVAARRALQGHTDDSFLQFDMSYTDSDAWLAHRTSFPKQKKEFGTHHAPSRFAEWKREFDGYVRSGNLPAFMTIRFPRDHTAGTSVGLSTPRSMVADNDYAVGQLVETVSRSPFWKSTAIFIVEDDAQDGWDHVDAHRSTCYVVSPYVRRGTVDHRFYNTDSALHTMELILGLEPLCQYDAIAPAFGFLSSQPENAEPYRAILPDRAIIAEVNQKTAYRAEDSARLNFAHADAVPESVLNDILWHDALQRSPRARMARMPGQAER